MLHLVPVFTVTRMGDQGQVRSVDDAEFDADGDAELVKIHQEDGGVTSIDAGDGAIDVDADDDDNGSSEPANSMLRTLTALDFPGVLGDRTNARGALAALGGEAAVRATVGAISQLGEARNIDVPPLTLTLRPGDGSSPSNIGSNAPVPRRGTFAVRVALFPVKREPDAEHHSAPVRMVEKSAIIGQITYVVPFDGIADWHYLGDKTLAAAENALLGRSTAPPDAVVEGARKLNSPWRTPNEWETRTQRALSIASLVRTENATDAATVLELCRPWRFSRSASETGGAMYAFRQHVGSTTAPNSDFRIGRDRRSDVDRLAALPWKVSHEAAKVPSAPGAPSSTPQRRRHIRLELESALRSLFAERPTWIRRAALSRVPERLRGAFAPAVRRVAYSFYGAGPFAQAWMRYGYDPRADRAARKWQVVEVRCKNPVVLEAVKVQYARVKAPLPEKERVYAWEPDFTLDKVPTNRNIFVQLADIRIPAVQSLLEEERYAEFSLKTGFFTEEGFKRVLDTIRKGLYDMARQFLGEQRSTEIVDECLRRRRRRRLQPRSVLDPKFRGRLATPRPPRRWQNATTVAAMPTETASGGDREAGQEEQEIRAVGDEAYEEGVGVEEETGEEEEVDPLLAGTVHPKFMNFEQVEGFEIIDGDDGEEDEMDDDYEDEEDEEGE